MNAARTALRKFPAYLLTGGLAAVIDIGVFALLQPHLPAVFLAAAASFLVAAVANYLLSAAFVYHHTFSSRGAIAFLAGASTGLLVNASAAAALAGPGDTDPVLAKAGGIGIAFMANFLINTFVVFRADHGASTS